MPAREFQLWNGGPRGLVRANASSSVGRKKYVKLMVKDWSKATARLWEIVFGSAGKSASENCSRALFHSWGALTAATVDLPVLG